MQDFVTSQFAAEAMIDAFQTLNHRRQRYVANAPFQERLRKSWIISIRHHVQYSGKLQTRVREGGWGREGGGEGEAQMTSISYVASENGFGIGAVLL